MVDSGVSKLKKEVRKQEKEIREQDHELKDHERVLKKQTEALRKQKEEIKKQKEEVKELKMEEFALHKELKKHAEVYVLETRKALATAVVAAFGFLMALSWREYIKELLDSILGAGAVTSSFVSAVVITLISVFGIILATRFLKVKE
jgi:chromosome segregation ATPase